MEVSCRLEGSSDSIKPNSSPTGRNKKRRKRGKKIKFQKNRIIRFISINHPVQSELNFFELDRSTATHKSCIRLNYRVEFFRLSPRELWADLPINGNITPGHRWLSNEFMKTSPIERRPAKLLEIIRSVKFPGNRNQSNSGTNVDILNDVGEFPTSASTIGWIDASLDGKGAANRVPITTSRIQYLGSPHHPTPQRPDEPFLTKSRTTSVPW